ncbi:PilZ domain-containing protein [Desulfobacterales bacterium HSG2]|nr:PilZ domain-containing protein [Desulfobacterales bacterium HSG2]
MTEDRGQGQGQRPDFRNWFLDNRKKLSMNDEKTKDQLIEELEAMRQQIDNLKIKIRRLESEVKGGLRGLVLRSPRKEIQADIEFIADFDIIEAKGVNISESGICFELNEDLPFEMQFTDDDGKLCRERARLIWVKRLPEGGYRFGLEFVEPETYPEL